MPFTNPILAGTTLIRQAIKSPDYVPGVSGWSINRNGSAEFNDITVRGELLVAYPSNGSYIHIFNDVTSLAAVIDFQPYDNPPQIYSPGRICAIISYDNITPQLFIGAPNISPVGPAGDVYIQGRYITLFTLDDGIVEIDSCAQNDSSTASSGAIGAAETVVLSTPVFMARNGRAYEIRVSGGFLCSVGGNDALFRLRFTNAAGVQINVARFSARAGATSYDCTILCGFTSTNDQNVNIVLTLTGGGAHTATMVAAVNSPRTLAVYDVGPQSKYPNWIAV